MRKKSNKSPYGGRKVQGVVKTKKIWPYLIVVLLLGASIAVAGSFLIKEDVAKVPSAPTGLHIVKETPK